MHRPAGGNEVLLPLSQKGVVTGRGFSGRKNVPALLLAMDARRPSVEIDASPMSRRMSCRVDTCPTGTAEERILRFRSRLASCKSTSRATLTSLASDRCSACPYIRRRHQDEIPRNPNHEVRKERFSTGSHVRDCVCFCHARSRASCFGQGSRRSVNGPDNPIDSLAS